MGDPRADPNEVLGEVMKEAGTFSSGLGIYYTLDEYSMLSFMGSFKCEEGLEAVRPGKRAPDVALRKPGTGDETRLIQQTPNGARFYVLVFAGDSKTTRAWLKQFQQALATSQLYSHGKLLQDMSGSIVLIICYSSDLMVDDTCGLWPVPLRTTRHGTIWPGLLRHRTDSSREIRHRYHQACCSCSQARRLGWHNDRFDPRGRH